MESGCSQELVVRPRADADLDAVEQMARVVHARDGYPVNVPGGDLRTFVASAEAMAAWVAVRHDTVVGHVALHPASSTPVLDLATSATGVDRGGFGVIARLLVEPRERRRGVGRSLLQIAEMEAETRGLVPILDVMAEHHAAIGLYEREGWILLGSVTLMVPTGVLRELVYRAPTGL